jgi:hypothetical protein
VQVSRSRAALYYIAIFAFVLELTGPVHADPMPQGDSAEQLKEVQLKNNPFSVGDPLPEWVDDLALPDAAQAQQTSLRLADTQILVGDGHSTYVRRAIIVKDAASLGSIGTLTIHFIPDYQRAQLHAIRILRDQQTIDQTKSLPVRFLQRETGLEQGVYSGEVTASILVNDLRVGDTLELAYTIHGTNPVFGKKFAESSGWDATFPVLQQRLVASYPESRAIQWRMHGDGDAMTLRPQDATENGMRKLTFEERSVPAVRAEPLTPSDYSTFRWLQFSEYENWAEISAWAESLFQTNEARGSEFNAVVDKLRALPKAEQVAAALEYSQSQVRYFSVSMG